MVNKSFIIVLVILLHGLLLGACTPFSIAMPTNLMTTPAPLANGPVIVYATPQEEWLKLSMGEFTKATGIQVEYLTLDTGEALARIRAEKNSPKADVWWGGTNDAHILAKSEGLIEKYCSPIAKEIPDQYKDADCYWTGMYVGFLSFSVNPSLLKAQSVPVPQTWADLVKPEYRGIIVMPNPQTAGTGYTIIATLVQKMGEDSAFAYLKMLHKNVIQYTKGGQEPVASVGRGESGIGINFAHYNISGKKQGLPITSVIPADFDGYEIGGLSLIKGGVHSDAARKLIDWTLTKQAQELAAKANTFQVPTNVNSVVPPESVRISDVPAIKYDVQWAGDNRQRLIDRWLKDVSILPK